MKTINHARLTIFIIILIFSLLLPGFSFNHQTLQAQDNTTVHWAYLPLFGYQELKPTSTSYYLPTVDSTFLHNLGCDHGLRDLELPGAQDSVIVLDFSYPVYDPGIGYGAALFEDNPLGPLTPPASVDDIQQAAQQFALGYYHCSGSDTQSNLVIGVGTNNKSVSIETDAQAKAHGQAWGNMVSELNQWAYSQKIFHQVQFYGASNMEVSWNTPQWTRAWIAGFEQNEDVLLLNFGDAAGCPYDENPHWDCGPNWEVEDVWYISWGAPSALPLPLIYLTNGVHAKQWAFLSRYSVENHGFRMDFTGVFTQWQYCQQFTWCSGTDNSPQAAYDQMIAELNQDPATRQPLRWKTDILWIRETEVLGTKTTLADPPIPVQDHPIFLEISKIEAALGQANLSATLRTSLENKSRIYQAIAVNILISCQTPASKD